MIEQVAKLNAFARMHDKITAITSILLSVLFMTTALGCTNVPKTTDEFKAQLGYAGESISNMAAKFKVKSTALFKTSKKDNTSGTYLAKASIHNVKLKSGMTDKEGKISSLIWPLEEIVVSSSFGPRGNSHHGGIDLAAVAGTPIYAAADGKVIYSGRYSWFSNYGKMIKIQHSPGFETIYAHNKKLFVKAGEYVLQGQLIASVGNSGGARGNHLHFEVIFNGVKVNPEIYLPKLTGKLLKTSATR